ncbi:unnamed protein product, partial [Prorocentrum cordatum]
DVLRYHLRSKHFFDVQAELPQKHMDWDSQPSPWLAYAGAPTAELPTALLPEAAGWRQRRAPAPAELSPASLGSFLRLGAGISAWKSHDGTHKWALRVAPSSGNLQTTELHLLLPGGLGAPLADQPAAYHYRPDRHSLELRAGVPRELVQGTDGEAVGFVAVFTSICLREAWKYGERALRSCHLSAARPGGKVFGHPSSYSFSFFPSSAFSSSSSSSSSSCPLLQHEAAWK